MATTPPSELKAIQPFLQRAAELKEKEPIVSFHCKYYAVNKAVRSGGLSGEGEAYLGELLSDLETAKEEMKDVDEMKDDTLGQAYVEAFALNVFLSADNQDRAGKATIATAKTFLAASHFLEVCSNFPSPGAEITEKLKYAKWKASDIAKAIKEGRSPVPGSPMTSGETEGRSGSGTEPLGSVEGEGEKEEGKAMGSPPPTSTLSAPPPIPAAAPKEDGSSPVGTKRADLDFPTLPTSIPGDTNSISPPSSQGQGPAIQVMTGQPPASVFNATHAKEDFDFKLGLSAQKHAKYAISALQYDDVQTAVKELQQALALLEPHLKEDH